MKEINYYENAKRAFTSLKVKNTKKINFFWKEKFKALKNS